MSLLSKPKREIYKRKITSFWMDFSHNKVGFFGLIIILAFVIIAALAPVLTPYRPISQLYKAPKQAERYAVPSWFTIFPQYDGYNPTIRITTDLVETLEVASDNPDVLDINLDIMNVNFTPPTDAQEETASITIDLGNFSYEYLPPPYFTMHVSYEMFYNHTALKTYFIIKNYTAKPYWEEYLIDPTNAEMLVNIFNPVKRPIGKVKFTPNHTVHQLDVHSWTDVPEVSLVTSSLYKPEIVAEIEPDPADILFYEEDVYGIQVRFEFEQRKWVGQWDQAWARLYIKKIGITFWGRHHGFLGTDFEGNDSWTELVYGARISLMVGVLAALLATTLGILYGVVSGFLGGFVDEFLMRVVDVLLCIPVLPLLLVLTRYYSPSVYFVVVLIAIFGWQGLSRVIRSRVLSLKEMAFIESARASGASDTYLMLRHLVPNVLPIAMAAMVLAVPGAIITEAALSFLGFGDPNAPTWGRILYHAYQLGGLGAYWVWLPPGLAITIICVGFVFIGHAVDEIVNPRLRRRR